MSIQNYLRAKLASSKRNGGRRRPAPARPAPWSRRLELELLEGRVLLSTTLRLGGTQTLVANTNVLVPPDLTTAESEMVVDINPTNPLNVVGFTHNTLNFSQIQVFFSTNGGNSWTRRLISNTSGPGLINDGFGVARLRYDPAIKFDANGNLFVAYGLDTSSQNADTSWVTGTARLVVGESTDGGNSFVRFTTVDLQNNFPAPPGINGPGVGVDRWQIATGPAGSRTTQQAVYVAYTRFQGNPHHVMISGSRDGAATFTTPLAIDDDTTWSNANSACPAVGPNGEVYVSWVNNNLSSLVIARKLSGLWTPNSPFTANVTVRNLNQVYFKTPVLPENRRGIFNGPELDVDRSGGAFNGRLYLSFVDQGFATPNIFLVSSSDQGAHWTNIAADQEGNVEGGFATSFLPAVAVDQNTGSVNVDYYTTDGTPDITQVNVRLASSTDGGVTFRKTNLSSQTSQSLADSDKNEFLEYIGLAVRNGTAQGFWADNRRISPGGPFASLLNGYSASASTQSRGNTLLVKANAGSNIILRTSAVNANYAEVMDNGTREWAGLWASIGSVQIAADGGNDTIDIENTQALTPVSIVARGGNDAVYISRDAGLFSNIQFTGDVRINFGSGVNDNLTISDRSDALSRLTFALTSSSIQESRAVRFGFTTGKILYSGVNNVNVTVNGGPSGNTFNVKGTPSGAMTLNTGSGADVVNVETTSGSLSVNGENGMDTVNIGSARSTQGIRGPLVVTNVSGYSAVNVDDSADGGGRTVLVYNNGPANGSYTVISGLTAPGGGDILLRGADLSALSISTGDGGNFYRIHDTPFGLKTTIKTGGVGLLSGTDNITIDGTTGALDLDGQKGTNNITIGSANFSLDNIQGAIRLSGPGGTNHIKIDDRQSKADQVLTHTLTATSYTRTGAAPISLSDVFSFTLWCGSAVNTIDVLGRPAPIVAGIDNFDILGGPGKNIINVGSADNQLAGIGLVTINGGGVDNTLNMYDQGTMAPHTYTLGFIFGLAQYPFFTSEVTSTHANDATLLYSNIENLSLFGGSGGNAVTISGTSPTAMTTVHTGSGDDVVTVGNSLASIQGPLSVDGQDGDDRLVLNDSAAMVGQIYNITAGSVLASDAAQISYADIEHLDITGTPFNDFFQVGDATHSLDDLTAAVTLNGNGGFDHLKFDDSASLVGHNYDLYADHLVRQDPVTEQPDAALISFEGMLAVALYGGHGPTNALFVLGSAAGTAVDVYGAPGSQDVFAPLPGFQPFLGPVACHGQAADGDFAYYNDSVFTGTAQTYTVSVNPAFPTIQRVDRTGEAPVTYDGVYQVLLYTAEVGGNAVNVQGVAPGIALGLVVFSGDQVTIGSRAPNLGGTLANIHTQVLISGAGATGPTVTVDDSADTTGRVVTISPPIPNDPFNYSEMAGLAPSPIFWHFNATGHMSMLGGAGDDVFALMGPLPDVALTIIGGTGSNTLDYSGYVTDPAQPGVTVNLQTGIATGLAGITDLNTGRVTIQNVIGSIANDVLTAGSDRSILIGGGGADQLFGGSGEDLLIAGTTDYTQPGNLNLAALDAIIQEWNRPDLGFDDRMSDLATGSNSLGLPVKNVAEGMLILLTSNTVHDDLAADTLTGGNGQDWFIIGANDQINNRKPGDAVTMI
jgi:hypothetical protein